MLRFPLGHTGKDSFKNSQIRMHIQMTSKISWWLPCPKIR